MMNGDNLNVNTQVLFVSQPHLVMCEEIFPNWRWGKIKGDRNIIVKHPIVKPVEEACVLKLLIYSQRKRQFISTESVRIAGDRFDYDQPPTGSPPRFEQQSLGIKAMMQDVDEHC